MAHQSNSSLRVLFFSAWYPNKYDAMAGLFVRKHAEVVARKAKVCVVYAHPDEYVKKYEVEVSTEGNLHEIIVYYPFKKSALVRKMSKAIGFFKAMEIGITYAMRHWNSLPNVVHVNVLTRNGVPALWLKKRYNIPFVVTEHWSRYLPQNFSYTGMFRKMVTEKVISSCYAVMPVCDNLAKAMQTNGLNHSHYQIVPNVVDDMFFVKRPNVSHEIKEILHVSCFDEKSKNLTDTLKALRLLAERRKDFIVTFIGTGKDFERAVRLADELRFPQGMITFVGEQPPKEVCRSMHRADMLLLYSNYENAPVVISEALASGLPIVASAVGGIPEMVDEKSGVLVSPQHPEQLVVALDTMLNNLCHYSSNYMQRKARKYSYESVGEQLMELYLGAVLSAKQPSLTEV